MSKWIIYLVLGIILLVVLSAYVKRDEPGEINTEGAGGGSDFIPVDYDQEIILGIGG